MHISPKVQKWITFIVLDQRPLSPYRQAQHVCARRDPIAQDEAIPAHGALRNETLKGVLIFATGMFLFSAVDTMAKLLTEHFHPVQIAWSRQLGLLSGVLVLFLIRGRTLFKTDHPWLQIGRGVLAACSATLFIVTIKYVPLADAVAVTFVAPFIVTVLGAVILKEAVGVRRWTAICIGFVASLIIIRPGLGVFHPAIFLVLLAALAFALRQILSRVLGGMDPTVTTVAYTAVVSTAVLTVPVPFVWHTPEWGREVWLLIGLAGLGALAEIFVIRGLELAQTVVLAPVHYTLLIWGTMYGFFVFGELPDGWTWVGAAIIVVTGIYMIQREARLARRALSK